MRARIKRSKFVTFSDPRSNCARVDIIHPFGTAAHHPDRNPLYQTPSPSLVMGVVGAHCGWARARRAAMPPWGANSAEVLTRLTHTPCPIARARIACQRLQARHSAPQ